MTRPRITVDMPSHGYEHGRAISVNADIRTKYSELRERLLRTSGITVVEPYGFRHSFYVEHSPSLRWEAVQDSVVAVIKEVFGYDDPEVIVH